MRIQIGAMYIRVSLYGDAFYQHVWTLRDWNQFKRARRWT